MVFKPPNLRFNSQQNSVNISNIGISALIYGRRRSEKKNEMWCEVSINDLRRSRGRGEQLKFLERDVVPFLSEVKLLQQSCGVSAAYFPAQQKR